MSIVSSFLQASERLQCFLTQRLLRQAFQWEPVRFGDAFVDEQKITTAFKVHILAPQKELSILEKEFPDKNFQGHHVKCPECWGYYMNLKRKYCGG